MLCLTRPDQKLVALFLPEYNKATGGTYEVKDWPDQSDIEAIALDQSGSRLAIEHTLIQPFVGEKDDAQPFLAAFSRLEQDRALRVPEYDIAVWVPIGSIPKGVKWDYVGVKVREWLLVNKETLPVRRSQQQIPGLPFDLIIVADKIELPGHPGSLSLGRYGMPNTFAEVVRKALCTKLPKLISTQAEKRILLLEKDNLPHGYVEIALSIESMEAEFPDLRHIDQIYVVNTVAWETENVLFFYAVWPGGVGLRFRVNC